MLCFKLTLYIRYGTARMTSLVCAVSPSYFCTFANRVRSLSLSFIPSTTPCSNYLMSALPKETRSGQLQRQYDNAQYVNVSIHETFSLFISLNRLFSRQMTSTGNHVYNMIASRF